MTKLGVKQFGALYSYFTFGGARWASGRPWLPCLVDVSPRGSFSMRGTHHISPEAKAGRSRRAAHTPPLLTVSRLKYEKIAPLSKQTLYHLQVSQNLLDNWTFGGSGGWGER